MGARRSTPTPPAPTTPRMGRGAQRQHHRLHNTANGMYALYSNSTGSNNASITAFFNPHHRHQRHREWVSGATLHAEGVTPIKPAATQCMRAIEAYPLASGDTTYNVIGNGAIGMAATQRRWATRVITETYLAVPRTFLLSPPLVSLPPQQQVFSAARPWPEPAPR